MRRLLALLFLVSTMVPQVSQAQDLDLDSSPSNRASQRRSARQGVESELVREIERGYYLKANIGSTMYTFTRGAILRPGTTLGLTVGSDFIDRERFSAAWEVTFVQALHNGDSYVQQAAEGRAPNQLIQGDIHTFTLGAMFEASWYPARRLGIGLQAGAGVMFVPLLMGKQGYQTEVVVNTWGGIQPSIHQRPAPVVMAGPTLEYYTKLSHFSIGLDVDALYAIGLDLGFAATAYFKYTF